jgi:prophage antirepressor-like protein
VSETKDLSIKLIERRIDEDKELLVSEGELYALAEVAKDLVPATHRKWIGEDADPCVRSRETALGMMIEQTLGQTVNNSQSHALIRDSAGNEKLGRMSEFSHECSELLRIRVHRLELWEGAAHELKIPPRQRVS